jgi:hypothetical protein
MTDATIQKNVKDVSAGIVTKIIGLTPSGRFVIQDLDLTPMYKGYVGLNNVNNTSDDEKPIPSAIQTQLDGKLSLSAYTGASVLSRLLTVDGAGSGLDADLLDGQDSSYYTNISARLGYTPVSTSNVGVANGIAPLDSTGKIASAYLPSYVDDVIEVPNYASLPNPGETSKIYVTLDTNLIYRWSGSVYIAIVASYGTTDSVPEGSNNLYFTQGRVLATPLTGFSTSSSSTVTGADTVIVALGKLQAQATTNATNISTNATNIANEITAKLLAAAGTVNLAQTGALDMANGLQLRWGAIAGAVTATFHHAFSNGAYMAIATAYSNNTGGPDVVEVSSVTTTTLSVVTSRADINATYTTGTWWYLAIGH